MHNKKKILLLIISGEYMDVRSYQKRVGRKKQHMGDKRIEIVIGEEDVVAEREIDGGRMAGVVVAGVKELEERKWWWWWRQKGQTTTMNEHYGFNSGRRDVKLTKDATCIWSQVLENILKTR